MLEYGELARRFNVDEGPIREAIVAYDSRAVGLSADLARQIERIVGPDYREYGSVSGMLDAVNLHGKRRYFDLYPIVGLRKVQCFFTPSLQGEIGEAIKREERYVTVEGRVRFKAQSFHPHAVDVSKDRDSSS